jgi:anti-anti-sigma factor
MQSDSIDVTTPHEVVEQFGVCVTFAASRTILHLKGEVDCLSSPYLRAMIDASIDTGHLKLVLDLAALAFMDAAGLRVIANAADRLELLGGTLAIRSPSDLVRRMLDITGMLELALPYPRESIRVF